VEARTMQPVVGPGGASSPEPSPDQPTRPKFSNNGVPIP
jgi:hypothetical protein